MIHSNPNCLEVLKPRTEWSGGMHQVTVEPQLSEPLGTGVVHKSEKSIYL